MRDVREWAVMYVNECSIRCVRLNLDNWIVTLDGTKRDIFKSVLFAVGID